MNETEHRKQMLIQQIALHRELMRREIDLVVETNPVTPVIAGIRRVVGLLGVGPRRRSGGARAGAEGAARSQLEVEFVTVGLPMALRLLRGVLERRAEKRATGA